jgi:tetratricopeptide (TPR) repeat protein
MNKPGQKTAMISSTARDLPEHRAQVVEACLRQSIFPIGMEQLPARDATGIQVSVEMVDKADIYIGIYAWRYGWVPDFDNPEKISVTEMEFNRAVERKIPILVFLIHKDHPLTIEMVETDKDAQKKLAELKERASKGRGRREFKSPDDLRGEVIHALSDLKQREQEAVGEKAAPDFHPPNLIPKPPGPYIAHPYSLLQTKDVVGRQAELNLLTDWVTTNKQVPADTRIFNLVAIGGMGKSALTWKWFNDIAPNELPKLAGRMWWSFYESDAHWENFIIRALAYVSGQSEKAVREMKSPDREDQLWRILDQQPFLLVLDGLERILLAYARMDAAQMLDEDLDDKTANRVAQAIGLPQSAADSFIGKHQLRLTADHRAGHFLRRLAQIKSSRILVTTRLYPTELQMETGGPLPGCGAQFLTGLTDNDALNLWREFKVTGSTEQLLPLFRSFNNYPLLIRALAGEVAAFRGGPGDFDKWRAKNPEFDPTRLPLKNAKTHVLEFALRGLKPEHRQVLHTIAAFRMPATWETLRALLVKVGRAGSPLPAEASERSGRRARSGAPYPSASKEDAKAKPCRDDRALDAILTELEDRGLVGWDKKANRYDLHPIVRGVVWQALDGQSRKGIYAELHTYFDAVPRPPDYLKVESLEDLTPAIELYQSLIGLERYEDAFVLFRDHLAHATLYRLSANRQRAQLVERLFPDGIENAPRLQTALNQSFTLNELAHAYHFRGEPGRAVPLYRRAVETDGRENDTTNAAVYLVGLSNAHRLSGALREAGSASQRAIQLGRKHKHRYSEGQGEYFRGLNLADCGFRTESEIALKRSLEIWISEKHQQFEGIVNAHLAERLLLFGNPKSALLLAQRAWELARVARNEADFIRAARLQGTAALGLNDLDTAAERLQHALTRVRAVSLVEHELPTLTALAKLHRRKNEPSIARDLLNQVWDAAERGPYPLLHADALNVLSQIERDQGHREAAIAAATKAYTLAWCDGISADGKVCYAYHYGLTNARKHLQELGASEPQLPPFDESKFEPLPDVELNPKDEFWVDPDKLNS